MNARWLPAAVIVVVASALLSSAPMQQTAAQLYQSGVYAEEIEGNLQKAIGIFEQVIKQFPGDRDTAANAQLHIGLCYERMGLEKAREAYEKVIKNYPGQGAAVAVAREKLDSLLRVASLGTKGSGGPTLRQVPTPPGQDVLGRVSPDGKYLADVGGGTCNVWIADLVTGKQRYLTPVDKNCSQGSPYGPRWSPDSTRLVFTWRDPAGAYDLRVVALDGSAPRVLLPAGAASWSEALDWSPDGRYILAGIIDRQEQAGLGLVSVADGSVRYLRTSLRYDPQDGRFSPDGLYVAYSRTVGTGGNSVRTRDVFILAVDEGREIPIVQHPADDAFVDWLPGGRGILFGSDRDGTQDLWAVTVERGLAQGTPTVVRRRVGPFTPLGLTRDGALYYRTPAPFMDVYTASLDPKTGSISGPPKKEPLSWEGSNRWPVWSPDGRRLAYVSARPTVVGPFQPGRAREFILCVYSADTNLVREYRHEKVFTYPRWNPDGRRLYVAASNIDRRGLFSLDLERGEYSPYYRAGENQPMLYFQFSGDGKWLVWVASRDDVSIVMRRDNRTGEEKELDRVSGLSIAGLALSPDARHLAWIPIADKTKVLKIMPFPDGTPKVIQQLTETGRGRTEITFAPDGRFIYYSDLPSAGGTDWHLWRIPIDGGPPQDMGLGVGNFEQLGVHPDGSRITFAAPTINPERSQVWVLENFLPARR